MTRSAEKVAVLLSGGVDSSVVALKAVENFGKPNVVAYTLILHRGNFEDAERAQKVARFLGIEHRVLDLREEFTREVIDYFVQEYRKGRTPNPCAVCNQRIKLGLAVKRLLPEGFTKILTGHYVRKIDFSGYPTLARGLDRKKDQSYFLAKLDPKLLKFLEFPLGELTKEEVKNIAAKADLPTASRKESQDICFLEGKKVVQFLRDYIPPSAGVFIYKGKVVGKHKGYYGYTIGQRRGLGLRLGKPVYVVDIDASTNTVIVGDREDLATREVTLEELTLFVPPELWKNLYGQVRYRTPSQKVENFKFEPPEGTDKLKLKFEEPFYGVAKGQIGALYLDDRILVAGGIIS